MDAIAKLHRLAGNCRSLAFVARDEQACEELLAMARDYDQRALEQAGFAAEIAVPSAARSSVWRS